MAFKKGVNRSGNKNPMFGKKHSDITKEKIKQKAIGRKLSEEHRKKISIGGKGLKRSEQTKMRISIARKGKPQPWNIGDKNSSWRGGISFEKYSIYWTDTLKRSIRERDNYVCQVCSKLQGEIAHDVHHIDYIKHNCNPDNLITLCKSCHSKTNHRRDFWKEYFYKFKQLHDK